jgi:hypothetical protein
MKMLLLTTLLLIAPQTGRPPVECLNSALPASTLRILEPCAFLYAQLVFTARYPAYSSSVKKIPLPGGVEYVHKKFKVLGTLSVGETSPDNRIKVCLTGDLEYDIDTLVHEYLHYLANCLYYSDLLSSFEHDRITEWIESVERHYKRNK